MGRRKQETPTRGRTGTIVGAAAISASSSSSPLRLSSSDTGRRAEVGVAGGGRLSSAAALSPTTAPASSPTQLNHRRSVGPSAIVTPQDCARSDSSLRRARPVAFCPPKRRILDDGNGFESDAEHNRGDSYAAPASGARVLDDDDSAAGRKFRAKRRILFDEDSVDRVDSAKSRDDDHQAGKDDSAPSDVDELRIVANERDGTTLIHVNITSLDSDEEAGPSLSSHELSRYQISKAMVLVRRQVGQSSAGRGTDPVALKTKKGIEALLRHCEDLLREDSGGNADGEKSTTAESNDGQNPGHSAVLRAVEAGLLEVFLSANEAADTTSIESNHVEVSIRLRLSSYLASSLPTAPPIPEPRRLPSKRRDSQYSQPHITHTLRQALGALFPGSLLDDIASNPSPKSKEGDLITAKMVYSVVDNMHASEFEHSLLHDESLVEETEKEGQVAGPSSESNTDQSPPPLQIPGLLPRLRPYQDAAVRWMLRREGKFDSLDGGTDCCREWELCWVVILSPLPGEEVETSRGGLCNYSCGQVIPLPKWRDSTDEMRGRCILYNPFSGWLTNSFEEARRFRMVQSMSGESQNSSVKGGLLAESMGLGKTVEVLALVLANRCPLSLSSAALPAISEGSPSTASLDSSDGHLLLPIAEEAQNKDAAIDAHDVELESKGQKRRRVGDKLAATQTRAPVTHSPLQDDTVCICGRSRSFQGCLSWVVCASCNGPMHGRCAGFSSDEQLVSQTMVGQRARVCSDDHCPSCVASKGTIIQSRATLIITPPSILQQWQREIARHTRVADHGGPLKVIVYPGVKALCNADKSSPDTQYHLTHAKQLADADVVLMTFQSLMSELGHSDDNPFAAGNNGRTSLRRRKRYRVVPSPMTKINWWRICLDEAQRVETPTAASAKMALKLVSQHKWCVSGTPIGRGRLDDLYGLLLFLKLKPFDDRRWFRSCFHLAHRNAMERILHLLREVMWRSTKANDNVRRQMGVPEQIERKVILHFSSIEKHFYDRQLEETQVAAERIMASEKNHVRQTKSRDFDMLSRALQKLRAACCHPQVGASGLGHAKRKGKRGSHQAETTRVLTMDEILDKLIDDARSKCEEAQRISMLHTNAIACLFRLKAEAKGLGLCTFSDDSEHALLEKSAKTYLDALEMADRNSAPTICIGGAILHGSIGFRCPRKAFRSGSTTVDWQIKSWSQDEPEGTNTKATPDPVWARVDFDGPPKNLCSIQARCVNAIPEELAAEGCDDWHILHPKECVLQVSSDAVSGDFVDLCEFTFSNHPEQLRNWNEVSGFRTNKSKNWRIVIKNYHDSERAEEGQAQERTGKFYVGLDIQLMEPDIAVDNLQRLHVLHNSSLVLSTLLQNLTRQPLGSALSTNGMERKLKAMESEGERREGLYMKHARAIHRSCQLKLEISRKCREKAATELANVTKQFMSSSHSADIPSNHPRHWWEDLLSWCHINEDVSSRRNLCDYVRRDLAAFYENISSQSARAQLTGHTTMRETKFPTFHDVDGLHIAMSLRLQESGVDLEGGDREACIAAVARLSPFPSDGEVYENSHCQQCRKDWEQTGPVCRHCRLEKEVVKYQCLSNDPEMECVLRAMSNFVRDNLPTRPRQKPRNTTFLDMIHQRAAKFFDLERKIREEVTAAKSAWEAHFDLLSDVDELNQCKRAMRLRRQDESLECLTEGELSFIVDPQDLGFVSMEHEAKHAMSLANLRRSKDTLRYLKNQRIERNAIGNRRQGVNGGSADASEEKQAGDSCVVCLSQLTAERAVLSCGHCYHPECLEKLTARGGGGNCNIYCPMRCPMPTRKQDVFLATEKRKDDGSQSARTIEGDFGTKVNRLVGDVLDAVDSGEKCLVFSQWEDMIEIICEAFALNSIKFVRPKSGRQFGEDIKRFRTSNCPALVMNVKNGAEGLTLVEATHVFMVEPILNCGLDMQAINRIHRIGQTSKTYVHRYIVKDTIEKKIDKLRVERQDNHFEDDLQEQQKHDIQAGGIDGGFDISELRQLFA